MKDKVEINKQVGASIAKYRKASGLSQAKVAEILGLSNDAISRMERGRIALNIERLFEFATLFQCRVSDLITDSSLQPSDQIYQLDRLLNQLDHTERKKLILLIEQMIEWKN
ncbi:TPA: helix-turn-helix transcriptional regulator [Haemophilus influenzae]|uniref:helix-turn-helix domain-containing protein n=1 Tax=Haemophilus influenzae TaxID=727 RepID=UPI000DD3B695|nr:helix-turn-helix transcriptional regulator [Haemophilus influenzae]